MKRERVSDTILVFMHSLEVLGNMAHRYGQTNILISKINIFLIPYKVYNYFAICHFIRGNRADYF
jgi:hypothetical protein